MKEQRPILVIGKTGQVGSAFQNILDQADSAFLSSIECQLSSRENILNVLDKIRPKIIINCAAYTAVDQAEREPDLAMAINAEAPLTMAKWCSLHGARLVHFSTDYVFNGQLDRPYREDDLVDPLGTYGRSKQLGEEGIREHLKEHLIFRVSWIFSPGGSNFVKSMMRLAKERETLKVVSDQIGAPTYAPEIAKWVSHIIGLRGNNLSSDRFPFGTYHLCSDGATTWYDFALAIFARAEELGFRTQIKEVLPITTREYAAPAPRPLNSQMDTSLVRNTFSVRMPHWETSMNECVAQLVTLT